MSQYWMKWYINFMSLNVQYSDEQIKTSIVKDMKLIVPKHSPSGQITSPIVVFVWLTLGFGLLLKINKQLVIMFSHEIIKSLSMNLELNFVFITREVTKKNNENENTEQIFKTKNYF